MRMDRGRRGPEARGPTEDYTSALGGLPRGELRLRPEASICAPRGGRERIACAEGNRIPLRLLEGNEHANEKVPWGEHANEKVPWGSSHQVVGTFPPGALYD